MASNVQIANLGLIKIGADTIASLTDPSKNAKLCAAVFEVCREQLLRSHPWNFATKRVKLSPLTDAPAFDYNYQFSLPSDCLRVIRIGDTDPEFKVEGRRLLTNERLINLLYISDVTDPNQFDSLFQECLALKISAEISYAVTGQVGLKQDLLTQLDSMLKKAAQVDAQEGTAEVMDSGSWFKSRLI